MHFDKRTQTVTQRIETAVPLDVEGVWTFRGERCTAKHFLSGQFACLVAKEYVAWMKRIFPESSWEVDERNTDMTAGGIPAVIETTPREIHDSSGIKIGWERLRGLVMTNERGTPVGVLVSHLDGWEETEKFYTIDGRLVGQQALGW